MTEEEKRLWEQERQMDHDIQVRYLRIQRVKRQMAEELDPFGEEFDCAAAQLLELQKEQHAKGLERMRVHIQRVNLEYSKGKQ